MKASKMEIMKKAITLSSKNTNNMKRKRHTSGEESIGLINI
jgi:hypothetical protein